MKETKPLAQSCKHEPSMVCFSVDGCEFESMGECLKQALFLSQRELAGLKEKVNLKHSRMSLKWRDSCFYYKKRARQLEKFILEKGLTVPLTVKEKEGVDGRVDSDSEANTPGQ